MSVALPHGYDWDHELRLGQETAELTARVWPNYLTFESDIPEPGLKFEITEQEFVRRFPVWGIRQHETHELVAFINAVQLAVDFSKQALPEQGWSFAIQTAGSKETPNCLCLLVANVDPKARGQGLSQILIDKAKQATQELGFKTLIAPVRPTLKCNAPFTPMTQYILKRTETGEIYDPWLQMHVKSGAHIVNICSESVRVQATLSKWREWTGLPLQTTGECLLPKGLVPLKVDTHRNMGVYCEPNVWVQYDF